MESNDVEAISKSIQNIANALEKMATAMEKQGALAEELQKIMKGNHRIPIDVYGSIY